MKLWKLEALERRVSNNHPVFSEIEEALRIARAGDRGERSLDYYVDLIDHDKLRCFYDLRLPWLNYHFQMDTVLVKPSFILITEIKNIVGDIHFKQETKQMIRILGGISETFPNPLLQVSQQQYQLEKYLRLHGFPPIPIYHLVVFANRNCILHIDPTDHFHIGKIIPIQEFIFKFEKINRAVNKHVLSEAELERMSQLFLREHTPYDEDVLKRFGVSKKDLQRGVYCPGCGKLPINREWGTWQCPFCMKSFKQAHIPSLRDYGLLINDTISIEEAREFLIVDSREVVKYIFQNLGISRLGVGRGTRYNLNDLINST
ncbi:nuclease-related domain-containing protein [Tenuibacillus multivorans]|uniref:nuclease-related domain-containing protein n=1 Tax=Tenuibacillus multivorans TaxID=237069 RepID=UPI001C999EFA|nr:nuclease-related domain-containing protein [Tenuibacillus multivorans]